VRFELELPQPRTATVSPLLSCVQFIETSLAIAFSYDGLVSPTLQQLRYFLAVASERHFTHAAEELGVAQPSLSKQIALLEADLGTPLFVRSRSGAVLTQAGEVLQVRAARILADLDAAEQDVQDVIGLRRGRVRLGATPSLCTTVVAEALRRYRDEHPGVQLQIEEGGSQDLVAALLRSELDLALVIEPEQGIDQQLVVEPLLRESLVLASLDPVPIASTDGMLRVADLRSQPLVMFRPGYDLRDVTLEACRQEGFTPPFAVEGGEMDAVLGFVEAGLGVALVPSMVLAGRPRLHATPLAPPGVSRTIAVAHHKESPLSHAAAAFSATLLAYLEEAEASGTLPTDVVRAGAARASRSGRSGRSARSTVHGRKQK
jgi:DNA-binding transcriptional LysR family regulator